MFLALSPCGAGLSLDQRRRTGKFWSAETRPSWPIRLFQVQLSLIYLSAVRSKLAGETAVRLCAALRPDVVSLDMMLARMARILDQNVRASVTVQDQHGVRAGMAGWAGVHGPQCAAAHGGWLDLGQAGWSVPCRLSPWVPG